MTGTRYPGPMEYAATLQNIPAAVSMVSGERLEMQKLEQLSDYAAYLPGVNAASGGSVGNTVLNVRGILSLLTAATVSFYLDEVPMGPSGPYGSAPKSIPWISSRMTSNDLKCGADRKGHSPARTPSAA